MLELFVQGLSPLPLVLLQFDLILIPISILSFPVPSFVELHIGCLSVKLDVLNEVFSEKEHMHGGKKTDFGLLFTNHNGGLQVRMYNDEHFVVTGLEK